MTDEQKTDYHQNQLRYHRAMCQVFTHGPSFEDHRRELGKHLDALRLIRAKALTIGQRVQVRDQRDGALAITAATVRAISADGNVTVEEDDGASVCVSAICVEALAS